MLEVVMHNDKMVHLTIHPKDSEGHEAEVQGDPLWSSSDPGIIRVEPEAGTLSCWAITVGPATAPLTPALVHVSADADLGEGIVIIETTIAITVTSDQAVVLDATAEEPVPRT
jgi:hypothetical protein